MKAKYTPVAEVLVPDWYDDYHCIGSKACGQTCCTRWQIDIDKDTYLKYERIEDAWFRDMFTSTFEVMPKEKQNSYRYARIKISGEEMCPYCNEDGWCLIQKNYGEDYLSRTCALYPRSDINYIGKNHAEANISLSCPVSAKFCVLPPGENPADRKIKFKTLPIKTDKKENSFFRYGNVWKKFNPGVFLPTQILTIRQICIDMIYNRSVSIADRILAITVAVKKLSASTSTADAVTNFSVYNNNIEQFADVVANTKDNLPLRKILTAATRQVVHGISDRSGSSPLIRMIAKTMGKFSPLEWELASDEVKLNHFFATTNSLIKKNWERFLETHYFVIENYLAYYVFVKVFPFMKSGTAPQTGKASETTFDFDKASILLAVLYNVLRFLFSCGMSDDETTDEFVIDVIASASRSFMHHTTLDDMLLDVYKNMNAYNTAYIAFILK